MKKGIGLPVFPGVAIGPAVVYRKAQRSLPISSGDPAVEKAKFNAALETAREQLTALLQSCGFTDVHVYGNSRMESPRDKEQRWHFTARRPDEA